MLIFVFKESLEKQSFEVLKKRETNFTSSHVSYCINKAYGSHDWNNLKAPVWWNSWFKV